MTASYSGTVLLHKRKYKFSSLKRFLFLTQSTAQGNLVCWYENKKDPLLMLRPVKVEMVWRKPRIFIFRDLLSPVEAKQIKDIATPKVSCH